MKVLLIDVNYKNGSTGEIVYNLYKYLNKKNVEVCVCYGRGALTRENNVYKFGLDLETIIHCILTRLTGYTGCFSAISTYRLIKQIEDFNPDVVHIHELHAYFVNIKPLLKYLAKKKVKVIHTLHCEFSYTGKCGHSLECEKWKNLCFDCPYVKEYPASLFFDRTKEMYLQKKQLFDSINNLIIVTPSKWLADRAKQSFMCNKRIITIPNGIDTSIFYEHTNVKELKYKLGIKEEKVILSVAPNIMSDQKGGKYIIALSDYFKNENIRFVLIGSDNVMQTTTEHVQIIGRIQDKNLLSEYYSIADAFLICSKRENFPTTCLESQCCGTPVYGFATGGTKETDLIKHNYWTRYGDLDHLIEATREILNSNLKTLHPNLSHIAKEYYSTETMCSKYFELYK